eukprot:TRINITY_DN1292_c1_g1_i1.p1 TRINITY_DN1292_c1_g1~~TRINITY_DN1292_c1_g1_i1.p1  ORF type:complete len:311 (-),score=99.09 TRINITY_DN1292_c1_g1_i1:175-1107(-)
MSGLTGTVKSWNGGKGYGFISCPQVQGDVLFGRDALPQDIKEVRGNFLEGRTIVFDGTQGPDGRYKATSVAVPYVEGKSLGGKIKSFSEKHGYGFITSSSLTEDVRFGGQDLPKGVAHTQGLKDELVIFDVAPKPDGKLAVSKLLFQSGKIATRVKGAMGGMMGGMGGMAGGLDMMNAIAQNNKRNAAAMMGGGMGQMGGGMGQMGGGQMDMMQMMMGGMGMPAAKQQKVQVQQTGTGKRSNGMIKSFNGAKGFGFISAQGVPGDIFFLLTGLPEACRNMHGNELQGKNVSFEIATTPDGKVRAQDVMVL